MKPLSQGELCTHKGGRWGRAPGSSPNGPLSALKQMQMVFRTRTGKLVLLSSQWLQCRFFCANNGFFPSGGSDASWRSDPRRVDKREGHILLVERKLPLRKLSQAGAAAPGSPRLLAPGPRRVQNTHVCLPLPHLVSQDAPRPLLQPCIRGEKHPPLAAHTPFLERPSLQPAAPTHSLS